MLRRLELLALFAGTVLLTLLAGRASRSAERAVAPAGGPETDGSRSERMAAHRPGRGWVPPDMRGDSAEAPPDPDTLLPARPPRQTETTPDPRSTP